MKRNVLIALGIGLALLAIVQQVTGGGKGTNSQQQGTTPAQTETQPSGTPSNSAPSGSALGEQSSSGTTQSGQTPPNKSSPAANPKHERVANAAATAYSDLNDAQILPWRQLRQKVDYYVVPTMRTVTAEAFFREGGPTLAALLKYPNVTAARQKPCCYYLPQMWRVESYNGHTARVSLFVYIHWQTIDDKESNFNDIVVVKMRKRKGRWLYVDSQPGRTPPKVPGKAIPRKDFDPYLEGYRDFVKTD
jgi:hypothetical protein